MAARNWVDTNYTFKYKGFLYQEQCSGFITATLQYDAANVSTTSIDIRFKLSNSSNNYKKLEFYTLVNPGVKNSESFIQVKETGKSWPSYSKSCISLTKKASDSSFAIPEIWLCNIGEGNSGSITYEAGFYKIAYAKNNPNDKVSGLAKVYDYFKTAEYFYDAPRQKYKTIIKSFNLSVSGTVATAPTLSNLLFESVILKDSNNRGYFQIKAKADVTKLGTGAKSVTRKCGLYGVNGNTLDANTKHITNLDFTDNVYRYFQTDADRRRLKPNTKYGIRFRAKNDLDLAKNLDGVLTTPGIVAPSGKCQKLEISPSKLLPNSNLSFSWKRPDDKGNNLGTKVGAFGYQIRVFKNGDNITENRLLPTGKSISDKATYWFSKPEDTSDIKISWSDCLPDGTTLKAGDRIKFHVAPYRYYLETYYVTSDAVAISAEYVVGSDDVIVAIKDSSNWKFGKVWVNTATVDKPANWKLAKQIYVKSDNSWKAAK